MNGGEKEIWKNAMYYPPGIRAESTAKNARNEQNQGFLQSEWESSFFAHNNSSLQVCGVIIKSSATRAPSPTTKVPGVMIAFTFVALLLLGAAAVDGLPRCFRRDVPLHRPNPKDCQDLIKMITVGDKASAPINFSRNLGRGFKVPHHWVQDSCVVIIDLLEDKDEIMKLTEIAFAAQLVSAICIGRPGYPDLGGSELAGPRMGMKVAVAGRQKKVESTTLETGWQGNNSLSDRPETS